MTAESRIAQLMVSRLCHDLAGPAGALGNGVELLKELGGDAEVIDLIAASAGRLTRQLDFFRVAFGLRGGEDAHPGWDEARRLAAGIVEGTRIDLDWADDEAGAAAGPVPAAALRLVLCLVLVARDALPRSGTVAVRASGGGGSGVAAVRAVVSARGERVLLDDGLMAALEGRAAVEGLTPRTVPGGFAARLARSLGAAVTAKRASAEEVRLSVSAVVDRAL